MPKCISVEWVLCTFGDTLFETVIDCWDTCDQEIGDDGITGLSSSDARSEESGLIVVVQKVRDDRGILTQVSSDRVASGQVGSSCPG